MYILKIKLCMNIKHIWGHMEQHFGGKDPRLELRH